MDFAVCGVARLVRIAFHEIQPPREGAHLRLEESELHDRKRPHRRDKGSGAFAVTRIPRGE